MNFKALIKMVFAAAIAITGCSDSDNPAGGGGSGGNGAGGTAGTGGGVVEVDCASLPDLSGYAVEGAPATATDDCTETYMPGPGVAAAVNTFLSDTAQENDVLCFAAGTYEMEDTIRVNVVGNIVIKGIGDSPDDTVLNFGGPGTGEGFFVEKDDVTIENMWVKNSGANAVEQSGTSGSVFRKLHVSWDVNANPSDNGAYGIYPTNCQDTLVEYNHVSGASDAGIYIGKCGWEDETTEGGIVRNNIVNGNVAGLEVENCLGVTVYDNYVVDNTGGLMPLSQPGASSPTRPNNTDILMENNRVHCNNHENFATIGVVQIIPVGSGVIMLGGNGVELRNNDIQGNDTGSMLVVSNTLTCVAAGADCPPFDFPEYVPYVQNFYAHDNTFLNNGTNVDRNSDFVLLWDLLDMGTPENPTPDILWDGYIAADVTDPGICFGENFTGTYLDLTSNDPSCPDGSMGEQAAVFVGCVADHNTRDASGRLCSPSTN